MSTHTPTAAILVIGNEILSGRTKDTNIPYIAERLTKRGIRLKHVRIVPDIESDIIEAVHDLRSTHDFVFTTGGIGATHDDITAATIAKAFGVALLLHEEAHQRLIQHYQDRLNENRLRMAYIPDGARLIDNPLSAAPGFAFENVYCMAGMPSVMQGMFDGLLPALAGGAPFITRTLTCDLLEGDIAATLSAIQDVHPNVEIGSYPFYRMPPDVGVSFVVQGQDEQAIAAAIEAIKGMITQYGGTLRSE